MSPLRPDLIECWVFRERPGGRLEYLLIRRAADRIFPGIWQPVTGGLGADERIPMAVLREVEEETGLRAADIERFYDLDQIGAFFDEEHDAVVHSVIFAARVRPTAEPRLSHEHVALEWVGQDDAERRSVWPPYRQSLELIEQMGADPDLARWFEVGLDGRRVARRPG